MQNAYAECYYIFVNWWEIFGVDFKNQNKYKSWYAKVSIKIYLLNYKRLKFALSKMKRKCFKIKRIIKLINVLKFKQK